MSTKPAKTCPKCGQRTRNAKANFCSNCGWIYEDGYVDERFVKICNHCNTKQMISNNNCLECGKPFYSETVKEKIKNMVWRINTMRNQITLGILALLTLVAIIVFAPTLPVIFGIWGVVAIFSGIILFIGLAAALAFIFIPAWIFLKLIKNIGLTVGASILVFALLVGYLMPLVKVVPANTAETSATTGTTVLAAKDFSLNDPAKPEDVDPDVWDKPLTSGVMIGENGDVYYTQSGKKGSVLLHGKVEAGQTVVVDAYRIEKEGKIYSEGCILVLNGPVDFDANPIFYTDGAAQLISTENTQKFLDENVWLKFSRGDRLADDSAWSYKKWALSNLWLPEGITFKKLGLTAEEDTYPSK